MSGQSHRHLPPSLEEAYPEPVQLVDSTEGLDEFAPESEQSLLRIEPPGAPTPKPTVIVDETGREVRRVRLSRLEWTRHASRAALVSSVLTVAVAGILVLQPPAPRLSAVDPTKPLTDSAPRPTIADPPPLSPLAVRAAASGSPSVSAAVPAVIIPPPRSNGRGTSSTGAAATDGPPIPRVLAPSASLAGSATTPVPLPGGFTASDAPVGVLATPADSTAAVPALGLSPVGDPPAVASSPSETFRSPSTDVPVDAVARPTDRDLDARAIENVLGQYRNAFNTLDAGAAAAVWPTVNEKTLARAFERLDDQDVSFDSCEIEVGGVHAEAACRGTARYVPKVGSRRPTAEARRWTFILRKASDGWLIDRIDAR